MMKKFIGIVGGNATGKSTRVSAYVDSLGEDFEELNYTFLRKVKTDPEGTETTINVGRLYKNNLVILGGKTKTGSWAGTDRVFGSMGNLASIFTFLRWLESKGVETVLAEGYFAVSGKRFEGQALRDEGIFESTDLYMLFYDKPQEYLDRTNNRSGKDLTEDDWLPEGRLGKVPQGWGSTLSHQKKYPRCLEEISNGDTVTRVDINAPVNWFVDNLVIS